MGDVASGCVMGEGGKLYGRFGAKRTGAADHRWKVMVRVRVRRLGASPVFGRSGGARLSRRQAASELPTCETHRDRQRGGQGKVPVIAAPPRRRGRDVVRTALILLGSVASLLLPASASASWGPHNECNLSSEPNKHCYGLAARNVAPYGGVLASIMYADTDYNRYPEVSIGTNSHEAFVDNEQWITFESQKVGGWIETGQTAGFPYDYQHQEAVELHPFYAEDTPQGRYSEYTSPQTVGAGGGAFEFAEPYNHYVLFDKEINGIWHVYWGCCEVHTYSGWPKYLTYQEAGVEAAAGEMPKEWGRQEVWDSDGGEWTPWSPGESQYASPAICKEANEEDHSAGDIEWSTYNC